MSSRSSECENADAASDAAVRIMMLRKPTALETVLRSVAVPAGAVPPNGLPQWYRLDLGRKLPVPKFPPGKIAFSRGYIGGDNTGVASDAAVRIMMLRKPTPLKTTLSRLPVPAGAVPPNGLPQWRRLELDRKLPMPKIPPGKVTFSKGYIGEDIRRSSDDYRPTFDVSDPNCNNVTYEYEAVHDPHLTRHFSQPPARAHMRKLGFINEEGHAICSLKQFNTFRKLLYNRYMDRVHDTMNTLDTRAKEDLTLLKVERDVARRKQRFVRTERAREHMEAAAAAAADDIAEKRRLAKERAAKVAAHVDWMIQMKERQRLEQAQRGREKSEKIAHRVQAAAEMELRRKITMIRQWRKNEKRRLQRLQLVTEAKEKRQLENVIAKWEARINNQNSTILQEQTLLTLYTGVMSAGAARRHRRSEERAFKRHCDLQKIKLANWRALHSAGKDEQIVREVAVMFGKAARGQKTVTPDLAQAMARMALHDASSGAESDPLGKLCRVRMRLDLSNNVPAGVMAILEEWMTAAINEFTRRRVCVVLHDIERQVYYEAGRTLEQQHGFKRKCSSQHSKQTREMKLAAVADISSRIMQQRTDSGVQFGAVVRYSAEDVSEVAWRSIKERVPTPVPSVSDLAQLAFGDRREDLLDPVPSNMPEQRKLIKSMNTLAKLLSRTVREQVRLGIDLDTCKITLPRGYRPKLDWNETIEELAGVVIDERVHRDTAEVRRGADFLVRRVLTGLIQQIRRLKLERKAIQEGKLAFRLTPLADFNPGDCSPRSDVA